MSLEQWQSLYMDCMRRRDFSGALKAILECRSLAPEHQGLHLHHILCLEACGETEQAISEAESLLKTRPNDPALLDRLAQFLLKQQEFPLAEALYRHASELQPQHAQWQLGLARVNQFSGNLAQASIHGESAVQINPALMDAWFFLSHLKRQTPDSNHIASLEQMVNSETMPPRDRVMGWFALAKELEDCREFKRSFSARSNGANLYRTGLNYDGASEIRFMRQIRQTYASALFEKTAGGNTNAEPIFIIGLPRSGTTLLERVIGSHDQVTSAGELTQFTESLSRQIDSLGASSNLSRTQMVSHSIQINFAQLGQDYIQGTRPLTGKTPHFIDKMPQNSIFAGLIKLALPNGRILLLERHPMDVCYAMYKQLFTDSFPFSYDLDELADYYIEWRQLMQHWQNTIPGGVHTVRYENLVSDLESEARSALDYCRLPWQDQCLEFQKNQQASTTASSSQVRQPVYSSSIGLWKNYREELKPLHDRLSQAGCLESWDD